MENKFSANLRILRKKNKLTLEGLGKILSVSKSALSDYENGHTVPSLDVCDAICHYFTVSIYDLQNVDFSEISLAEIQQMAEKKSGNNNQQPDFNNPIEQLEFENKLLKQQSDGLKIQLQLVKQLTESKISEIKSLQIQIKLLEEKLKNNSPFL
jgi:transcriptional regulator with XRE-family HTH domain